MEPHAMFDEIGLCNNMLTLLDRITTVGIASGRNLSLVADGIKLLRDKRQQEEESRHGQDQPAERQDL